MVIHLKISQIDCQKLGLYEALSREVNHLASLLDYLLSAYSYTNPSKGGLAVTKMAAAIEAMIWTRRSLSSVLFLPRSPNFLYL